MIGHSIHFTGEIWKIIPKLSPLMKGASNNGRVTSLVGIYINLERAPLNLIMTGED